MVWERRPKDNSVEAGVGAFNKKDRTTVSKDQRRELLTEAHVRGDRIKCPRKFRVEVANHEFRAGSARGELKAMGNEHKRAVRPGEREFVPQRRHD